MNTKMKMKLWKQQMLLQHHIALWELEVPKSGNKPVINFQNIYLRTMCDFHDFGLT